MWLGPKFQILFTFEFLVFNFPILKTEIDSEKKEHSDCLKKKAPTTQSNMDAKQEKEEVQKEEKEPEKQKEEGDKKEEEEKDKDFVALDEADIQLMKSYVSYWCF